MNLGKTLAASAMMGILGAIACGGAQSDAKQPATDRPSDTADGKHGCGNHPDGGSCNAKVSPTPPEKK